MPFPIMPILKLKSVGGDKAGDFDGVRFGTIPKSSSYELQNIEVIITSAPDNVTSPKISSFFGLSNSLTEGIFIRYDFRNSASEGSYEAFIQGQLRLITPNESIGLGEENEIKLKIFNGNFFSFLNGVPITSGSVATITYTSDNVLIGAENRLAANEKIEGTIRSVVVNELNSSGDFVKELINLDWNNGDVNTVPNIGADAPASSDMTWVPAGSGTYVDV